MDPTLKQYYEILDKKRHSINDSGFDATYIPDIAFDFQGHIIKKAVKRGRMAIFADTGLGKTLIQLSIAHNVVLKTNKRVLILTPLAVGIQFIKEAEKIGVPDVYKTKKGELNGKIIICNYERLHYLNSDDFVCCVLDESSILKNFDGKIKHQISVFIKKMPYRFLSTATPSPNDFIELGTSSEALGYMGYMDMLTKFFKNNSNSVDSNNRNIGEKFYLKPHAEKDFFSWVNQWSIMVKMPSDIGYSDEMYNLPKLIVNTHEVKNQSLIDVNGQVQLFTPIAKTMIEVRHEQKQTEVQRCEVAYELSKDKVSVYWCNTNAESKLLSELDKDAHEIIGSMSIEKKEDILMNFADGNIDRVITKAKMTSFGLNWQHCNNTVYFPTWSYEQYYQAIRRFWRFGQQNDVNVNLVISDGQKRVIQALDQKTKKAIELYDKLRKNVNNVYDHKEKDFTNTILKPKFIQE